MATALLNSGPDMDRRGAGMLGFTLLEMIVVVALIAIISAMGVPLMMNALDGIKLGQATREVERELQIARLTAVQANQPIRVRFNCPSNGDYRITELIGTPGVPVSADSATNRCALSAYPYPAGDTNALTRPNKDGPVRSLDPKVTFTNVTTIEFWPDGTAHTNSAGSNPWPAISGTGYLVTLTKGTTSKSILVNGVGKIQVQ